MDSKEAIERLQTAFKQWINSDDFISFQNFLSKFRSYSFFNILLIYCQMPTASLVAGFSTWKKMKRFVKKGQSGIMIFAPNTAKRIVEKNNEEKEMIYVNGFRRVYVFDISQTDGEPIPEPPPIVINDDYEGFERVKDAIESMGYTIKYYENEGTAHGFTIKGTNTIFLNSKETSGQKASTMVHEWAHLQLGDELPRADEEMVVQTASYFIMSALGFDTSWYTARYVQGWSNGKDWDVITRSFSLADSLRKKFFKESAFELAA